MRQEGALVPDPLAYQQPRKLTELVPPVPGNDHMVGTWRPFSDPTSRRMVLDVHGQWRQTRRRNLQVKGVLAWPQPHLNARNGRECVAKTHLRNAGGYYEPPRRETHASDAVDGLRLWRGVRHAAVAPPKPRGLLSKHRAWIDPIPGAMRSEATVDITAVNSHRPAALWTRPPAALVPTTTPPEHSVVRDWTVCGYPLRTARVQLLNKLPVYAGWTVDEEPSGRAVLLVRRALDQLLEQDAFHLLRTLPCPRWQPLLRRVAGLEQGLGVLAGDLVRGIGQLITIEDHDLLHLLGYTRRQRRKQTSKRLAQRRNKRRRGRRPVARTKSVHHYPGHPGDLAPRPRLVMAHRPGIACPKRCCYHLRTAAAGVICQRISPLGSNVPRVVLGCDMRSVPPSQNPARVAVVVVPSNLMLGRLLQHPTKIATRTVGVRMATESRPLEERFGTRIQKLRRDSGLTQRQVAAELGIDFTYLSKLENDRGEPPGEATVRKLAAILQTDPEELLALAGKIPSELRLRAQQDVEFARFLRRLPNVPDAELQDIYRRLNITPPET
jgi:transcriptional regulator with XRE-family HTH domain